MVEFTPVIQNGGRGHHSLFVSRRAGTPLAPQNSEMKTAENHFRI